MYIIRYSVQAYERIESWARRSWGCWHRTDDGFQPKPVTGFFPLSVMSTSPRSSSSSRYHEVNKKEVSRIESWDNKWQKVKKITTFLLVINRNKREFYCCMLYHYFIFLFFQPDLLQQCRRVWPTQSSVHWMILPIDLDLVPFDTPVLNVSAH